MSLSWFIAASQKPLLAAGAEAGGAAEGACDAGAEACGAEEGAAGAAESTAGAGGEAAGGGGTCWGAGAAVMSVALRATPRSVRARIDGILAVVPDSRSWCVGEVGSLQKLVCQRPALKKY